MGILDYMKAFGINKALDYLEQDPDANLPKLMEWVDKFGGEKLFPAYQDVFRYTSQSILPSNVTISRAISRRRSVLTSSSCRKLARSCSEVSGVLS